MKAAARAARSKLAEVASGGDNRCTSRCVVGATDRPGDPDARVKSPVHRTNSFGSETPGNKGSRRYIAQSRLLRFWRPSPKEMGLAARSCKRPIEEWRPVFAVACPFCYSCRCRRPSSSRSPAATAPVQRRPSSRTLMLVRIAGATPRHAARVGAALGDGCRSSLAGPSVFSWNAVRLARRVPRRREVASQP